MRKTFLLPMLAILLMGCNPDSLEVELYTSDIETVATSDEVIDVPVTASFTMMGDDNKEMLPKVAKIAKKYLSEDSEIVQSKGDYGDRMVIETTIPLGTKDSVNSFLQNNRRVAAVAFEKGEEDGSAYIDLVTTGYLDPLNNELGNVNMMLDLDFPADETTFRVVSDSEKKTDVLATAVFVSGKAHLYFSRTLERRDSVDIVFSGEDGSVYKEIGPYVEIRGPK